MPFGGKDEPSKCLQHRAHASNTAKRGATKICMGQPHENPRKIRRIKELEVKILITQDLGATRLFWAYCLRLDDDLLSEF